MIKRVGNCSNYYGGIYIKDEDDKYYWGVLNYDGIKWEKIPHVVWSVLNSNMKIINDPHKDRREQAEMWDQNNLFTNLK